jgi:hypothetical protein
MTKLPLAMSKAVLLALVLLAGASARIHAQPLQREELTRYARAHFAMAEARDEFHRRIAGIHDDVGLARAREEMDLRVAQILEQNTMSSERYGEITLLISQREEIRAAFDEISRQLRTPEPG